MKKKISAGLVNDDYVNRISAERCETVQYAAVNHKMFFLRGFKSKGENQLNPETGKENVFNK